MKTRHVISSIVIGAGWFVLANQATAITTFTQGAGSAVSSIDLSATFDLLTVTYTNELNSYKENGLSVTTGGQSWGADPPSPGLTENPFHILPAPTAFYAIAFGTTDWVTIQTTNQTTMFAVEFMYGNTWSTGDSTFPWGNIAAVLDWQTWSGGNLVSSGTVGQASSLPMGTIVGFSDPVGFDQLMVRSTTAGNGDLQAVALDNLNVQVTPIPEPSTLALVGGCVLGLLGLAKYRDHCAALTVRRSERERKH